MGDMDEQIAVGVGDITTAHVTKKELNRLLEVARDKRRKVENNRQGEGENSCDNWYVDGRLFAGGSKGWYYLVIKI